VLPAEVSANRPILLSLHQAHSQHIEYDGTCSPKLLPAVSALNQAMKKSRLKSSLAKRPSITSLIHRGFSKSTLVLLPFKACTFL
jgi:hypothetical protein